jgi:hypothetical protein
MKIILEAKREPPIIRVRLLKRRKREVKKDPKLGANGRIQSLVAIGRIQSLVANGRIQSLVAY